MPSYRDYTGPNFPTIGGLARHRIRAQASPSGNTVCPAAESPFLVSEDNGQTWRNPSHETRAALEQAVREEPGCCRNLGDECPAKS